MGLKQMKKQMNIGYFLAVIFLMLVLPVISIVVQNIIYKTWNWEWYEIGKWFVFWAIGVRILGAGIKQVMNPEFTAKEILKIENKECFLVVRELGFANICIGITGVISIVNYHWYIIGGLGGCLYLGLAGIQHIFMKEKGVNEKLAMISDLLVFVIVITCFIL
jgi:hypothetical protein